ncbi:hypothetical protein CAS74_005090 [Pichia kudriavzevii]|uniref:Mitochondrial carrier protein MTM1 n=1 Tax=Pichia kudriavzevii TaxID=4909 RepID=A0A099P3L5_PICKU|nr:uncharacterized protein C5L36_0B01190 [Pichia kudriavzevii]AWU74852.1 hypothetical protein C5L36_0B01190 [Pichia kudriavzevii]KGK38859.1 hypothetical protein JL09_g2029 [Pichia kudriavzevii]ONH73343.1 Mitochondrial carrier protein MTM1 [Pichia kudriavzevii]OUT19969.1 hypothetical protein CAS74_005090 [Pichia kudriavzevii]
MTMSSEIAGAIEEDEDMFDQDLKGAEGVQVNAIEPSRIPKFSVNGAKSPNADLTLSQRMLSACAGSLLTSLVVTPFDVVRIRLQQQELLYPVQSEGTTCCRKVFWENQPNEKPMGSIKGNFCQPNTCFQEGDKISGTFQGIKKISSQEGFTTLYRGLGLTLVMAIPANVVYFSGYEFLRDSSPFKQSNPVLNPLMCGSIARVLAATSVAPLELIKTRTQAVPSSQGMTSGGILRMVVRNSINDVKQRGLSSIFKGLGLTLWRDVPFSGIYWSTYEYITHALKKDMYIGESNNYINSDSSLFLRSFIGGSLAGITAAFFTNPFDVGKTRMQVSMEDEKKMGSLASKTNSKDTIFKFISQIYKNEGIGALYVGLVPRSLKIAPACAIMISSYEMTKKFFKEKSA